MSSIQIVNGKRGFHLKVNGMFISHGFDSNNRIKSIDCECGIPCGAIEWVSVRAIRKFWNEYMHHIIASTIKPYISVWGSLILKSNQSNK